MIADAHAHVWTLDVERYPWQPTFGLVPTAEASPDDLLGVMDRQGVAHAILVQPSAYGADHTFMLDTVRRHPGRFLAVGLVDPGDANDTAARLALVRSGGCVGLRVNLPLDPARAAALAAASGWSALETADIPICLRATPAHQVLVRRILAAHPSLRVVVDHVGLPELGQPDEAMARLAELAAFDNCLLKIAGLARFSALASPYADTWPVVRAGLQLFGASRLVWGSDYPAAEASSGYPSAINAIEAMPFLTSDDRHRLTWRTARELWGVPAPVAAP